MESRPKLTHNGKKGDRGGTQTISRIFSFSAGGENEAIRRGKEDFQAESASELEQKTLSK